MISLHYIFIFVLFVCHYQSNLLFGSTIVRKITETIDSARLRAVRRVKHSYFSFSNVGSYGFSII